MKCRNRLFSGREWEKFANPKKAKTSMTMNVNTMNHWPVPIQREREHRER